MRPSFIYGTAWKEERTAGLVERALRAGFRAIDTANQRKHYCEAAVGEGIAAAGVARGELFVQTKFTYQRGQDHRLPYDPQAPLAEQVRQSMQSSLEHLRTGHVDSYVLHGPASGHGWTEDDDEVWRAMEEQRAAGYALELGVSNVDIMHLEQMEERGFRPWAVQNRCLARFGWDREVRIFCRERGIVYQGFWLLTGNVDVLQSRVMTAIAEKHGASRTQTLFAFARLAGITPLTGTSSAEHMAVDLGSLGLELEGEEVAAIERVFA